MAINPHNRKPLKILSALAAVTLGLYGLLFAVTTWGDAQWQPKLGLDLEGGTQIVLKPVLVGNTKVTNEQLTQARDIIVPARRRQRCRRRRGDHAQGRQDIVVSMPGTPDKATEDAIRKSSQMRFRPVLAAAPGSTSRPRPAPRPAPPPAPPRGPRPAPPRARDGARRPPGRATSAGPACRAPSSRAPPTRHRAGRHRHGHGTPTRHAPRHGADRHQADRRQRPGLDHRRDRRRVTRSSTAPTAAPRRDRRRPRPSRW